MLPIKIKELRKSKGYSQTQLAQKLRISQGAVSQWETGETVPSAGQLVSIADIFGISLDELLERNTTASGKDEAWAIRERLRRDPSYRLLFSAADSATPEHLRAAAAMLKALEPKKDDADAL